MKPLTFHRLHRRDDRQDTLARLLMKLGLRDRGQVVVFADESGLTTAPT
jgi:hypothetical protein